MSHVNWIIVFSCLLILTAYCSYVGDDDVIYQFLHRKPTPQEGLRRIRWVLLKAFASIYGGLVTVSAIQALLKQCCSVTFVGNPAVLTGFACMAIVSLAIGLLQNGIRRLRGRPRRPVFDPVVWQRSRGPLGGKR